MPGFHLRFLGRDVLPKSPSPRDVEDSFGLSAEDLHEHRRRFRGNAQIGAAYQLVTLRATGRAPDALTGIPKALLAYVTSANHQGHGEQMRACSSAGAKPRKSPKLKV